MVTQRATEIERFHAHVDADPMAVSESRVPFEQWLADTGASEDTVHELAIVFSELVTNAVHASSGASDQIDASAWIEDGKIVVRVVNPVTPTSRSVDLPDLSDPLRTGGRGLLIVRAYTDVLRTEIVDGNIAVRCERRIRT